VRATIRLTTSALLVAVLGLGGAAVPAGAPAQGRAAAARPSAIDWRPCPEDPDVQCGTLRVPVDWDSAYGPTVDIALARRPATDPAARIGALVVNPGGPGGSGVDLALAGDRFFSPGLHRRFDIVGFDPRGVARSNPVVCSAALTDAAPSPLFTGEKAFAAMITYNRRLAADCRRRTGPVFDHVDTLSVVRDIEALRIALSEPRLSFYGISYGTLMGQQYADRYPDRVRAVGLDSTIDHSVGTRDFLTVETDAVQDSFDEFTAWCARDRSCALHGRDVRKVWATLLSRAGRGDLRDPIDPEYRLTVLDLLDLAFSAFYEPQWYSLGHYLQAAASPTARRSRAERAAVARVASTGRQARQRWRTGGAWALPVEPRRPDRPRRPGATAPSVVENPFQAIFCEDWTLPVRDHRHLAAELRRLAGRAPQMLVSPLALTATVSCLGWPSPADNPQRRIEPARSGPLLLINARHDPATAYRWAEGAAAQLGSAATLVPYDGWGHTVYGRSACVTSVADRYLVSLWTPAAGGRCPAVAPEPFGVESRTAPTGPRRSIPGW
jgi:pimeloyl-ACP methyl ester carboxylesterase